MEVFGSLPLSGAGDLTESLWDQAALGSDVDLTGFLTLFNSPVGRGAGVSQGTHSGVSELDLLANSNFRSNQSLDLSEEVGQPTATSSGGDRLFPQPQLLRASDRQEDINDQTEIEDEDESGGRVRIRDPLTGLAEPATGSLPNGDIFLDFSSTNSGTLTDQDGQGTGFTSVQPNKDESQEELYDDSRVELNPTAGTLSLTAEQGSDASTNTLENALQLPIAATQPFEISTRLTGLTADPITADQQGGIFVGPSQDDYVKLAVVGSDDTDGGLELQFFQEQTGKGSNVGGDSGSQIIELPTSSIDTLDLFLAGDPFSGVLEAAYRINSDTADPTRLTQQFEPRSPETFFADKSTAHAGILPDTQPAPDTTVAYDSFGIQSAATAALDVKINFQPGTAFVPTGYIKDVGRAYSATRGFGWVRQDSLGNLTATPLDITANTRNRDRPGGIDQRLDTLIHLQGRDVPNFTGIKTPAAWEYAVPDGKYSVAVSVGDQSPFDSTHKIRLEEGQAIPIRPFTGKSTHEYERGTATVNVTDGRLTVDAIGGTNTKLNFIEIKSVSPGEHPSVPGSDPTRRQNGVNRGDAVNLDVALVNTGSGVDATTLNTSNVRLYRTYDNTTVAGDINTSGGGDAIVYQPKNPLDSNTNYTLRLGDGVEDQDGNSFLPFSTTFTTGTAGVSTTPGVDFRKSAVYGADGLGASISSLVVSPDGSKLYAAALDGNLRRWTINSNGTLTNLQTFGGLAGNPDRPRAIVGITFDPKNSNVLWVSHNDTVYEQPAQDFTGKISKLTLQGSGFNANIQDYVVGLPRSAKDHLSNSLAFGPGDKLYLTQGSNSATGAADTAWGPRGERLLTAAVLQIDPRRNLTTPFNVKTEGRGADNYNPYATNAPVKLFATGVRNAYDLVWHSNGRLYVPTNGSAANGNTPDDPTTTANEGLTRVPTQNDYLFKVARAGGGYYGHPNPKRNEYILNGGNPTNGKDPAEVVDEGVYNGYNVGIQPEPSYRGFAYDFGRNRSPNGAIEYKSNTTFGGALKNQLLVVEFSGGKDILALKLDGFGNIALKKDANGKPIPEVTQAASGFTNPLDLAEARNGNLYVAELVDEQMGRGQITLLRPA